MGERGGRERRLEHGHWSRDKGCHGGRADNVRDSVGGNDIRLQQRSGQLYWWQLWSRQLLLWQLWKLLRWLLLLLSKHWSARGEDLVLLGLELSQVSLVLRRLHSLLFY